MYTCVVSNSPRFPALLAPPGAVEEVVLVESEVEFASDD